MSVLVAVRIPDALAARVDAATDNRSAAIIVGLKLWLDRNEPAAKPKLAKADLKPQIVKRAPSKLTEEMYRGKAKCPHDYMNWLSCPTCNPR